MVTYTVSADGRVTHFDGAENLVGTNLYDSISVSTLRDFWAALIRRALRSKETHCLACRCDSADVRREISLELKAESGAVVIRSEVLSESQRDPDVAARISACRKSLTLCSWCARVRTEAGWIEVEQAIEREQHEAAPGGAQHGICPSCADQLLLMLCA